jgi:hypothetical protein
MYDCRIVSAGGNEESGAAGDAVQTRAAATAAR